jgi:DNA-binding beta-propeller fold protein YncE
MKLFIALLVALLAAGARASASTTGFAYALDPATGCGTCEGPQVLVFDGGTTRLVTKIPLDKGFTPVGIAISPDGAHLYVSQIGLATRMIVIDARTHAIVAKYPVSAAGLLAVNNDDTAVYIRVGTSLARFDTATHTITATAVVGNGGGISFNRVANAVVVPVATDPGTGALVEYDPITLTQIRAVAVRDNPTSVSLSRTGSQLYVPLNAGFGKPAGLITLNAATLAVESDRVLGPNPRIGAAEAPTRQAVYLAGRFEVLEVSTVSQSFTAMPLPDFTSATAIAIPPGEKYAFTTNARLNATGLTAVTAIDLDTRTMVMTYLLDGPPGFDLMTSTPDGVSSCTYRLDSAYASFNQAQADPVTIRLTTGCAWVASSDAPWIHLSASSGPASAAIVLSVDANLTGQTRRATVTIGGQTVAVTQGAQDVTPAFGVIDTPLEGASGLSGAIAITGWALDDLGVQAVYIYRDPLPGEPATQIPIGTATLVEGARPDVQAIFPTLPFASRAGWGYQLLTNTLPPSSDGSYRLWVYVADLDRHSTFLGTRVIHVNNATATLPFGAIDTPGQGETVSGVITNWGWALTPPPANIPADGSTIDVLVDGTSLGHPTYGLDRPDIAALFPGYANTHSAVGFFTIDTATLTNGVHTIAWVVRDSLGRTQGIGSRYFTVFNP